MGHGPGAGAAPVGAAGMAAALTVEQLFALPNPPLPPVTRATLPVSEN